MSKPRSKELLTQELIAFKCCIQGLNTSSLNLEHLLLTRHSMLPLYTEHSHTHTHAYTDILIYPHVYHHIYNMHPLTYRHVGIHTYTVTLTCGQTYTFAYTETLTHRQA